MARYRCVGYKQRERNFTLGQIYEVTDGKITSDTGYTYNCFNGVKDIIKDFLSDFYEFKKVDDYDEIKIYRVGNKVIATNKDKQEGVAKCNTKIDTFDFNVGAKLAFDRLMEKIEIESKYNGKFIVTESNDIAFTVGKIYEVVDGKFCSDITINTSLPLKRALHNFNELKEYLEVKDNDKDTYSFDIKTNIKILEIKE